MGLLHLVLFTAIGFTLSALPTGMEVADGQAKVIHSPDAIKITVDDKSILNWKEFSIEQGESVQFIQPGTDAVCLNRVLLDQPSRLLGLLKANGQIVLVNPHGVVVGKEASINTGSFIASTLDVFQKKNGDLAFHGSSEKPVENYGRITASHGEIFLIGAKVNNQGELRSIEGNVALLACRGLVKGKGSFFIRAELNDCTTAALNEKWGDNFSSILFPLGESTYLTHGGQIQAPGTDVALMGQFIEVQPLSTIDTSSDFGGGTVRIGGDFQGKNDDFFNATSVFIGQDAAIYTAALEQGNAGNLFIWSDESTQFYGKGDARGGPLGGNGAFAEVSGKFLSFEGFIDLRAERGSLGTLLLDPTDISVTGVSANNTLTPGFSFPLSCGGVSPVGTQITTTAGAASTLSPATITGQLAVGNLIIDSTTGAGGAGNITVNAGQAISYSSANSLIFRAPAGGSVTILADVQNTMAVGGGNVIIDSQGPAVAITTSAGASTSVGSSSGLTQICAPNAALTLTGANGGQVAQVGFFAGAGATSTGAIQVSCDALTMTSGAVNGASCQIGHGRMNTPGNNSSTTGAATIDVNVTGDINMSSGTSSQNIVIGHGSSSLGVVAGTTEAGNITVTSATGSLLMNITAGGTNAVRIGHGCFNNSTIDSISGDIAVSVPNGSITMLGLGTGSNSSITIGHGSAVLVMLTTVSMTGDIDVSCRGDLTLDMSGTATNFGRIGNSPGSLNCPLYNQTVRVVSGGNIALTGNLAATGIGAFEQVTLPPNTTVTSNVEIIAGGNISTNSIGNALCFLGSVHNTGYPVGSTFAGQTFVAAGGNISLLSSSPGAVAAEILGAYGSVFTSAGGNITITAGDNVQSCIGTDNRVAGGGATTHIYAQGNIIANNGTNSVAPLGYNSFKLLGAPTSSYSVDVRGGGDIQVAASYGPPLGAFSTGSGNLFFQADSPFATGDLWTYSGTTLISVAGGALVSPLPVALTSLLSPPIAASSAQIDPDCLGALRVVTAPNPLQNNNVHLLTTSGNITVHSAERQVNNTLQNLIIGPPNGVNNLLLSTTSGNIDISCACTALSGTCPCIESFNDISIQGAVTTTGSIFISANNNITTAAAVSSTGANPVSLLADLDRSGGGALTLGANVSSAGGPVLVSAGGDSPNTSSILQNAGAITSAGGNITAQAGNSILFSGTSPVSVNSGTGNISATALIGTINIEENIVSTAGDILMTAGADININPAGGTSIAGGSVGTAGAGAITLTAARNIDINGDPTSLVAGNGAILTTAGDDTTVNRNITTSGPIVMISGNNMFMNGTSSITSTNSSVTLVVDNDFPNPPLIGTGFFSMATGTQVNSASTLRIFTAQQPFNMIAGDLNGPLPGGFPGTLFQDTNSEVWCTYYPSNVNGTPLTVFYKNCLQEVTEQSMVIVQQFLFDINGLNNQNWPYYGFDEYYGWPTKFFLVFDEVDGYEGYPSEPYFQRKKNSLLLAPKSYRFRSEWRMPNR